MHAVAVRLVGVQDPNGLWIKARPESLSVGHMVAEVFADLNSLNSLCLG